MKDTSMWTVGGFSEKQYPRKMFIKLYIFERFDLVVGARSLQMGSEE